MAAPPTGGIKGDSGKKEEYPRKKAKTRKGRIPRIRRLKGLGFGYGLMFVH